MAVNNVKQHLNFDSGWTEQDDDPEYIFDEIEAGFTRRMDRDEFHHVLQTGTIHKSHYQLNH